MLLGACAATAGLNKLNVVALDARGQPVTDLGKADFQVLEDGKPQDIAFFRFTGAAALHPTVVLIDLLNERILSDSVVGREVIDALQNREMSENLYLYFLNSHGELYPIHALPRPDTELTPAAEPWTRNIAPMVQAAIKQLYGIKPVDDRDIKVRYDLSVRALQELGGQLTEISGRKNLVWVTHGVPLYGFSLSSGASLDFTNPLRWFCEELAQAQIVVYTVQQSQSGAAAAMGSNSTQTLEEITSITGGRAYLSDRAGAAIQQAGTDSRANYQIAYYSESLNPDGKHHKIRVTCQRKDVRLRRNVSSTRCRHWSRRAVSITAFYTRGNCR